MDGNSQEPNLTPEQEALTKKFIRFVWGFMAYEILVMLILMYLHIEGYWQSDTFGNDFGIASIPAMLCAIVYQIQYKKKMLVLQQEKEKRPNPITK